VLDKFASLSEDEIFKFMEATESTIWDASASYAFLCKINPEKLTRLAKRICEKLNFHLQGIALLVQCGMDPNLQITFKGQPMSLLHRLLAPEYENPNYLNSRNPLATTLLEYGAHPENLLPHVLKRHKQDANLNLIVAFIKAGANRNPPDLAEPLLSYAPYPDVTLLLLQNGFPVDARDEQGRTALMRAVQLKDTTQVRLLLEAGANPKLVDIQQRNFLHYLAHSNDNNPIQMIQFLTAECNLDLDEAFEQRNVDGKTPIEQLVGHIDDKTVRDFVINYYQRRSEKLQEQAEQLKIQADRLVRLQQDVDYFKSLATDQAKDQKPHISG
jgi:ankyrin repeat protein